MNKILLSTVVVSLLSSLSYAGPKFEITPMVGKKIYNYSDDAPRFDDGEVLIGVRANGYLTNQVSVQLGVEASRNNQMGDGGETDLERGMLNLQYDLPSKGKVTPFVLAGMGYEKLHREAPLNVDSQAFVNAGAGLRYSVNNRVDLVAEARAIRKVEDDDDDIIGSIGVGYKYGNSYQTKPAKGISVKALSIKELAALTPVAPVETAIVEPIPTPAAEVPAAEVIDTKIVYDTNHVNICDSDTTVSGSDEDSSTEIQGYYVQVIALRKNSPDVIISRLNAKGYDHILKGEGNLTRVLVGPYESRGAAKSALRGLKKVRHDAFIYHAK